MVDRVPSTWANCFSSLFFLFRATKAAVGNNEGQSRNGLHLSPIVAVNFMVLIGFTISDKAMAKYLDIASSKWAITECNGQKT